MTAKNSDKRHPLVQMVEHYYFTIEGRKENIASREERATEVVDHLILKGVHLTPEVEKVARFYGERLHLYEHALRLLAACFRLDSSLFRDSLADALIIEMIGEAQKSIGQGLAAAKSNKSRRKELTPEAYDCVTKAFFELCYRNEKPPGAQLLRTHAKQLMASQGIARSERELLTRYRASEIIKSMAEAFEYS